MNMQNIPSHATDIRHMFRATAAGRETLDCSVQDNMITITLPRYYYVQTDSGEVEVKDLVPGTVVSMLHSNTPTRVLVHAVEEADDISCVKLTFVPEQQLGNGGRDDDRC